MTRFTDGATPFDAIRRSAWPLRGAASDYDPLLDMVGEARFVLLGEASHGTHECYSMNDPHWKGSAHARR